MARRVRGLTGRPHAQRGSAACLGDAASGCRPTVRLFRHGHSERRRCSSSPGTGDVLQTRDAACSRPSGRVTRSSPWCMSSAGPCPARWVQWTSRPGETVTKAGQERRLTRTPSDVTGWRDRGRPVERPPAFHGRPVLVPGAPAQVCELVRPRDVEGLPRRHLVDVRGRAVAAAVPPCSPAVARSRCSYGSAVARRTSRFHIAPRSPPALWLWLNSRPYG